MRYTRRAIAFSALCCLSLTCSAQPIARANLANVLNFESQQTAGALRSWGGGPSGTLFADNQTVHGGKWSARLERNASSQNDFSTITLGIPIDFKGDRVELRGFLKLEDVSSFAGLWLREDGESSAVAFDNMQNRAVKGTSDWKEYSIVLPLRPEATMLVFGVLQSGTGKTWADDLQLLVDGKPIWDVPTIEKPKTALDLDHEFDAGSRFAPASLSRAQVENLTTLGKVWGFLNTTTPESLPVSITGITISSANCRRFLPRMTAWRRPRKCTGGSHPWVRWMTVRSARLSPTVDLQLHYARDIPLDLR